MLFEDALPAIRALVAKRLIEGYGFSQKGAAAKLGLTQPAISQYKRGIRGRQGLTKDGGLSQIIDALAKKVSAGLTPEDQNIEFFEVYKHISSKK